MTNINRNNNNYNNNNFNNNNNTNSNYYRSRTTNNNNFNNFNNNNFNNFNNNNFNNFNNQSNDTYDIQNFKLTIGNRLLQLNSWIDDGKFSFNSGKLKEGIIEIMKEINKCEYLMRRCEMNKDKIGYETARNMRMDIEQTCARYEDLVNDRRMEPFYSSFSGNIRQYYFNKNAMFGNQSNTIPMGNFNDYYKDRGGSNNNYYPSENYQEKEVSIGDKLSSFGNTVKDGLFFVGGKIKDGAVSGYNFVKDKFNDDEIKDV